MSHNRRQFGKRIAAGTIGSFGLSGISTASSGSDSDARTQANNPEVMVDLPGTGQGTREIPKMATVRPAAASTASANKYGNIDDLNADPIDMQVTGAARTGILDQNVCGVSVLYFDFEPQEDAIEFRLDFDLEVGIEVHGSYLTSDSNKQDYEGETNKQSNKTVSTKNQHNAVTEDSITTQASSISVGLGLAGLLATLAQADSGDAACSVGYFIQNVTDGVTLTSDNKRGDIKGYLKASDGIEQYEGSYRFKHEIDDLEPGDTYRLALAFGVKATDGEGYVYFGDTGSRTGFKIQDLAIRNKSWDYW